MTSPLDDEDAAAALAALLAALDDITARLLAERETALRCARQRLSMRDEILAMVAHDLRDPLDVIVGCAEQLREAILDPGQRRHVEQIVRGVQRASRLVRDLIAAGDGTGSITVVLEPLELTQVVVSALETQQLLASSANVVLCADVSEEVPPVLGDEARLQEVLENLIGNAVKFSAGGGPVTVGVSRGPGEVHVWVRDHGRGIAAEHLPHIFERFWQADKRDRRGTGLGLAICRAIVLAHRGRIWCESELGRGTTITFAVPALTRG